MIHFSLYIDKFYESEFESGLEVLSMICIEYPIIHMVAQTNESMEEEYDELDRFIVRVAHTNNGFNLSQFSELTGLSKAVFKYRAKELVRQKYIVLKEDEIIPVDKGIDFLNNPVFEREIIKTRSFLVDGVTHEPLRDFFYKEGSKHLVSDDERDSRGFKVFNPSLVHTPPNKNIVSKILGIQEQQRIEFCIPVGLKSITDYDFSLMTYPIVLVMSRDKSGKVIKKMIDGFRPKLNVDTLNIWQTRLVKEIQDCHIFVEETSVEGNPEKRYILKSSWGTPKTFNENAVLDISKSKLGFFIKRLYSIEQSIEEKIEISKSEVKLMIDRTFFECSGPDKRKLIEACLRQRDYIRQREYMGVWVIFFHVVIADDFVNSLTKLYVQLTGEIAISDLLQSYEYNYKLLRAGLIALENFDKLEELDTHLFLHSRENSQLNYLSINNE